MRRLALALLLVAASTRADAQQAQARTLEGRIMRTVDEGRMVPVPQVWIVLHRVSEGGGAPVDSQRTSASGRYAFRYRAPADDSGLYFASVSYGGVAYFTAPTREVSVRGGDADLAVFDTTSGPVPITIRGRHIIVTAPDTSDESVDQDVRTIIEVYEISNDGTRTRVPGGEQQPTHVFPLPFGVTALQGGEGDVSADAFRFENGMAALYAPIAPGVKSVSFRYELPINTRPSYQITDTTSVLEVLIEDPRGSATGANLAEVTPVQIEGRGFKRFLAEDVVPPVLVRVTAPGRPITGMLVLTMVMGVGAALLLGVGMVAMRRGPGALSFRRAPTPEAIAMQISALDTEFEALANPTDEQRAAHHVKRMQLKGQLNSLLAKRDELA